MNNLAHQMTNQLELDVRAFARELYDAKAAYIFKVPEEMQQTPVDFFGFTPSGRAILIECKQVKRSSLPIGTSNGLQGHQWSALELADRCGSHAILVWRNDDQTQVLTFGAMRRLTTGRKSIPWNQTADAFGTRWRSELRDLLTY